jgi:addiction module HigA family antidote
MSKKTMPPLHPGEILQKEFLDAMGISQYRLAKDIGVQATRISQIIKGRTSISADTALRLGLYFGTTAEFWMNAQGYYDLEAARDKLEGRLKKEVVVHAA